MRSTALWTLALFAAPAQCAQRPKRSSTAQTCNGNFVCPAIVVGTGSTFPTSTGYDVNGYLTCEYPNSLTCEYDQNTSTASTSIGPISGLSGAGCVNAPVTAAQCANTDKVGAPLVLQFSGSGYLYCFYHLPGMSQYVCYYHPDTGKPYSPGTNCPDSVICAGNTASTRRRSSADSVSALRRRLGARSPPRAQIMLRKRQYS